MENVPGSSRNVGKLFRFKKFCPCEDIQLCRSHVHISQDPMQAINQTSATFYKGWPIILIQWMSIIARDLQSSWSLGGD